MSANTKEFLGFKFTEAPQLQPYQTVLLESMNRLAQYGGSMGSGGGGPLSAPILYKAGQEPPPVEKPVDSVEKKPAPTTQMDDWEWKPDGTE